MHTTERFLNNCPGLAGQIARLIYDRLEFHQPGLALGAALSFVGALKSGRQTSEFGINPNIYSCSIALTSTGKSQCQSVIEEICAECGLDHLLMGQPASDVGLLHALSEEPRKLLIWDEFGIALRSIGAAKASYETRILATIMDLYSAGKRKYRGKEYARSAQEKRIDIDKPMLSLFAASTPARFFDSLSSDFVEDGFLPRILLFLGEEKTIGKESYYTKISNQILCEVIDIETGEPEEMAGDVGKYLRVKTDVVQFDEMALEFAKALKTTAKIFSEENEKSNPILSAYYRRMFENTVKVAIILSEKGVVTENCFRYSEALVRFLTESAARVCFERLFDNQEEKNSNKIREKILARIEKFLKVGEVLPWSVFSKQASFHKIKSDKLRNQTIDDLIEENIIKLDERSPDGFQKSAKYITRIK